MLDEWQTFCSLVPGDDTVFRRVGHLGAVREVRAVHRYNATTSASPRAVASRRCSGLSGRRAAGWAALAPGSRARERAERGGRGQRGAQRTICPPQGQYTTQDAAPDTAHQAASPGGGRRGARPQGPQGLPALARRSTEVCGRRRRYAGVVCDRALARRRAWSCGVPRPRGTRGRACARGGSARARRRGSRANGVDKGRARGRTRRGSAAGAPQLAPRLAARGRRRDQQAPVPGPGPPRGLAAWPLGWADDVIL